MDCLLLVGHDEAEVDELRERLGRPVVACEMLPRIQVRGRRLLVESPEVDGRFVPVSAVVFHGIFEDDLPFLSALALWGGPCFPNPRGMMDCRLRVPCLVRALAVTQFGGLERGFAARGTEYLADGPSVAKWGEWHCGENKERFDGAWRADEPALVERFVEGASVRVQLVGPRGWQFRLGGPDWKKSIHGEGAAPMPPDDELRRDARRLAEHFGLEILGVDYIVADDGRKYLLEVNHIPSVTAFPFVREAYLQQVAQWVERQGREEA